MDQHVHVGLVVIDDLSVYSRSSAEPCAAPRMLAACGRSGSELLPPTLAVPDVLVVCVTSVDRLVAAAPWLSGARALVLLIEPGPEEFRELTEDETRQALDALPQVREVLAWGGVEDTEALEVALDIARDHATSPIRMEPASAREIAALAPGEWHEWSEVSRGLEPGGQIAAGLFFEAGSPRLRSDHEILELATGARHEVPAIENLAAWSADGRHSLRAVRRGAWCWDRDAVEPFEGPGGRPINGDPCGRVFWTGHRGGFDWWLGNGAGARPFISADRSWPTGHGKKLWGYQNNDPIRVELSLACDAALSHYEHDALLVGGLPLRWQVWGDLAVAVRFASTPVGVFYQHHPDQHPGDPRQADDADGRSRAPVVALGPGRSRYYAVGFEGQTWRVTGERAERMPLEIGWGLYDADHRMVASGEEHLLGASAGQLLLRRDDTLARMRRDGRVAEIGSTDGRIDGAVPVCRSANLILWRIDEGRVLVRLV